MMLEPPDYSKIPPELKNRRNWVVWKLATVKGKRTKVPYNPLNPQWKAKSNDASTWSTFQKAVEVAGTDGFNGIGYEFGSEDSPYTGIDLDRCRDKETGEIQEWAARIIESLSSYTEISPSGRGIHIIVKGKLPRNRKGPQIEIYSRTQFFTMTGNPLPGLPLALALEIHPRQRELEALHRETFGEKEEEEPGDPKGPSPDLTDIAILDKARQAANGAKFQRLWVGNWQDYPSPSEADQALCCLLAFYTRDFAQIDRLFRQSGLCQDPERIKKWDRQDYRTNTINKALALVTETYQQGGQANPGKALPHATITGGFSLSDLGNARRLVAQHGQDLHYSYKAKKWLVWNGRHWEYDFSGEVYRRAKQTIATIYAEAGQADEDSRKKIVAHALRSEHDQRIKGMLSLAQSEPRVPVLPEHLDRDHWLLNVQNGTLDLRTGKLRPHDRKDLITRLAPVAYDPTATCPLWQRFLDRIQKSNAKVISFIHRILGYSLTGSTREQCFFVLWGPGANGKSTLLNIFSSILGNYSIQTPTETLLAKQKGQIPNDLARLDGPRFVTALEASEGRRLNEAQIKQLTGQDKVPARFLFGEFFDFIPQFKLFLATNHRPVIKDTSHAFWRRIRLIPFLIEIPEAEQDKDLLEKLKAESPSILAWAVRGCLAWQADGLGVPEDVQDATSEYRKEQDVVGNFLADCCVKAPGASAKAKDLYSSYVEWSRSVGEKYAMTQKAFGTSLTEHGFERAKGTGNKGVWRGLGQIVTQK